MKKQYMLLVQLLTMLLPASLSARVIISQEYNGLVYNKGYVYDFQIDNIFYTIHENGVFVSAEKYLYDPQNNNEPYEVIINSSYNGTVSFIIPETVKYGDTIYTVRGIDDVAFKGCNDIESVDIPLSVRYIGKYAFSGCTNLYKIYLPDEINTIKEMAFSYCVNLKRIQLPNCLLYLNYGTFKGCNNLQFVYIPKSVTGMDKEVFSGCVQLEEIHFTARLPISFIDGKGESDTFYGVNKKQCTVFVPQNGIHEYTYVSWNTFNIKQNPALYNHEGINYVIDSPTDKTVRIVDAICCCNLIIPPTIKLNGIDYTVESIDNYAFANNGELKSVIIPEGLTSIGQFAFSGCYNISSLTIPSTISTIGTRAFYDCYRLTSVYVKKKNPYLIYVGECVFSPALFCDLYVPDQSIKDYCCIPVWSKFNNIFADDISRDDLLFKILSEDKETAILIGYENIKDTIIIPSVITINEHDYAVISIKDHTFSNCLELTSVIIPTSIETIGTAAFYNCSNLKEIILPPSLSKIEKDVFRGCKSLDSISFPANLKRIGIGSFRDCKKLQSLYLPNGVEIIDANAFDGCYNLKEIYIPASVSKMDFTAFQGCSKIESITWNTPNIPLWDVTISCSRSLKKCILGEEIKTLYDNSFMSCRHLSSIVLPKDLEIIGNESFNGCLSLTSIVIPQKVEQVNYASFFGCLSLKKVVIEGNPTFHEEVFAWCDSIDTIVFKSQTPPQMCHSVYSNLPYYRDYFTDKTYNNAKLFIPEGSIDAYAASIIWSRFCSLYTEGYESDFENKSIYYTYHTGGVFAGAQALQQDSFNRFFGFDGPLTPRDPTTGGLQPRTPRRSSSASYRGNIVIPESVSINDTILAVTGINYYAFIGCNEIESVYIPESVNNLGYGSFAGCSSLKYVNIPCCVSKIPNAIFYDCSSLSSIEIPESVTTIGYSAFYGCSSLSEIIIPAGVEFIDQYAFAYCSSLKRIVIEGNPVIDETAFKGCETGLEFVYTMVESHKAVNIGSDSGGNIQYGIDGRIIQSDTPGLHIINKDGTISKSLTR